jgi:hypothetical protein
MACLPRLQPRRHFVPVVTADLIRALALILGGKTHTRSAKGTSPPSRRRTPMLQRRVREGAHGSVCEGAHGSVCEGEHGVKLGRMRAY